VKQADVDDAGKFGRRCNAFTKNKGKTMKIICIGDSLTFGSVGYSYIKYLKPKIKAINAGVNGDTTLGAYKRLKKYLGNSRYADVRTYIVSIGTNDIFLPYLSTLSPVWKRLTQPRIASKKCLIGDDAFAESYENILRLLKEHNKDAVVLGLPFIQMKGIPSEKFQARNAIIKRLAEKYGMPYIDTYSLQKSALKARPLLFSWGATGICRVLDAIIMLVFPFSKDWFSKARRLELTVDGAHFNSLSARIVAAEISKQVLQYEREGGETG
jgi:lysophospholipase L1-like esterase